MLIYQEYFYLLKKIFTVRGTTVLISFVGAIYCALVTKNIYKIKNYWAPVLFLTPSLLFFFIPGLVLKQQSLLLFSSPFFIIIYSQEPKILDIFFSLLFAAASFYSHGGMWPVIGGALLLFV